MPDSFCESLQDMCDDLHPTRRDCTGLTLDKLNQLVDRISSVEINDSSDPFFWSASILFGVALGVGVSFFWNRVVNRYQNYNEALGAVNLSPDQP